MNSVPPPKPAGPRLLQRSQSGLSPGRTSPSEVPDFPMTTDPAPAPRLTRATSSVTHPRPSLTLDLDRSRSTPYPPNASRFPEGPTNWLPADTTAGARNGSSSPLTQTAGAAAAQAASQAHDENRTALPITPRSISKIVSLSDLRQLVRRMEAPPPPSPAQTGDVPGNGTGNGGDDVVAGGGGRDGGVWSDSVLDVVALLGEGASGAVQAVQDKRTGRRFARKTIITHEGPLKQLVRELAFLSGLRHTNVVRFYGAYMSPSNSEVKLVMELCEGKSLAAIGEQIRRRKGRVGEKVARILAEEVSRGVPCPFFLPPSLPVMSAVCLVLTYRWCYRGTHSAGPARPGVLALQESHPQGHQALEHSSLAPGRSQTL